MLRLGEKPLVRVHPWTDYHLFSNVAAPMNRVVRETPCWGSPMDGLSLGGRGPEKRIEMRFCEVAEK